MELSIALRRVRSHRFACLKTALLALATGVACQQSASPSSGSGVPGGGGNPSWLNEPAGFTPIESQSWASWSNWVYAMQDGYMSLVSNQDGPLSAPSAIQWFQPTGLYGGGDPPWALGHTWYNIPASRYNKELFVGLSFKVSANFQGHSSGVQKLYFLVAHTDGHTDLWLEVGGSGSSPLGVRIAGEFEGLAPINIEPNQTNYLPDPHPGETAVVISRGVWRKYVLYVKLPATSGGNGTLRVWMDGILAINRTDVPMSFDANNGWVQVQHDPIWGGVGDTKQHDDYVWFDHTYFSSP